MSKGGFDPERVDGRKRDTSVIPQILDDSTPTLAKGFTEIKVVGVGGGGSNTVDRMIEAGVQGIDFIAVNTDAQALEQSQAKTHVSDRRRETRGLGTGGDAGGREGRGELALCTAGSADGADMIFLTAGLGGGTGSGAAPWWPR